MFNTHIHSEIITAIKLINISNFSQLHFYNLFFCGESTWDLLS